MDQSGAVPGKKRTLAEFLHRVPQHISQTVEHFFYRLGFRIAQQPRLWLISCSAVVLLCLAGLFRFRQERNPLKLWVPPDSDFVHDTEWLLSTFGEAQRTEAMIMTGEDVLEPRALLKLNEITKRVFSAQTTGDPKIAWSDICFKVPVIVAYTKRDKRQVNPFEDHFFDEAPDVIMNGTQFEPSVHVDPKLYCSVFNSLPKGCLVFSLLDLWEYDSEVISKLTKADVIEKVNRAKISPTLGHPMNFTEFLGGVTTDASGKILSAKAVRTLWTLHVNFSEVNMDKTGNDAGTSDWATEEVLRWESEFVRELHGASEELKQDASNDTLAIWYEAGRSFGDISSGAIFQDVGKLVLGVFLMTVYMALILSNRNWVEFRILLTFAGLLCIGGAFIIAVGLCSLLGVPYGPVHTSLPFLLMGLGVDDIFVMMASWDQVMSLESNRNRLLTERIGLTLGHAGSAICITSLTDVVAFIIGASTILPSLQSFCIYAAVGVLVNFLLQITFFIGFFALDAKRIEAKRNGVVPCLVHEEFALRKVEPSRALSWRLINNLYSKVILTLPGKIVVTSLTLGLAGMGTLGSLRLQQWFEPEWFLPKESYLANYLLVRDEFFSERGHSATVFLAPTDYPGNFRRIVELTERLSNMTEVQKVEAWPRQFSEFVDKFFGKDPRFGPTLSDEEFNDYLSKFLSSRGGGKFRPNFRFAQELTCGQPAPTILVGSIDFEYKPFAGPHEWIPAMDDAKRVARESGIDGFVTVWSKMFATWVTDKVIAQEVVRNLLLALICVMATTALLIAEPQTCFWILLCVLLTLLDVCGFMYYWGLTIDIVSCIGLELAIGLSVDYAAHVAHAFLNAESEGDKDEKRASRALIAVRHIGAAVTYGAGSTLLALSLLAFSEAYVFRSFFKIFLLVILFGLWHGLFLLPVVLSTVGPRSLRDRTPAETPTDDKPNERELRELLNSPYSGVEDT